MINLNINELFLLNTSNCLSYFQQQPSFNIVNEQFTPVLGVVILPLHEIYYARPLLGII